MTAIKSLLKEIAYAYPSSPDAQRLKLPKGGYTVAIGGKFSMRSKLGFGTWLEAKAHADTLPWPYSPFTMPEPKAQRPKGSGCGKGIHVIGTNGGTMPCGSLLSELDGPVHRQFCSECEPCCALA